MLEHKIMQLEERILSARVITKKEISKDSVSVGSTVRLRDLQAAKTFEYHIVGSVEANPNENKLSNESPIGKAILGRKKGETVEVSAPARRPEVQDPRDPDRREPSGSVRVAGWKSSGSETTSSPRRARCSRARFRPIRPGSG